MAYCVSDKDSQHDLAARNGECRNGGRDMDIFGSPEMHQRIKMGVCHTSFFTATAEPLSGLILPRKNRGWVFPTSALGLNWQHVLRVVMASLAD